MTETTPERVAVRNKQGDIVYIKKSRVDRALETGGYSKITPQEEAEYNKGFEEEEKYGGTLQGARAGIEGLARGATLSGTDFLASQLEDQELRKGMEARKRLHPWIATGGELVGFGLPLLATGGAAAPLEAAELGLGGALRASTSLPRLVGEAGELAGKAATSVVGESLGGKIASAAARGAAENALLSAGDAVSEDSLSGHPELIAEHLMPHMAKGALLGAGLGAGLSGALGAYRHIKGAKKLLAPLTETAQKAASEIESLGEKTAPIAPEMAPEVIAPNAQTPSVAEVLGNKEPQQKILTPNRYARRESLLAGMEGDIVTAAQGTPEEIAARDASENINRIAGAGFEAPRTPGLGGPNIQVPSAVSAQESELAKAMRQAEEARSAAKTEEIKIPETEVPAPLLSEEQPSFREKVSGKLQEKANESLVASLDPSLAHYKKIKKFGGGVQELARNIREAIQRVYGHSEANMTEKKWFHLLEVEKDNAAKLQKNIASKLDEAPTQIQASDVLGQVQDYANDLVGGENKLKASAAQTFVNDLRNDINRVVQKAPARMYASANPEGFEVGDIISHSDLWELRKGFDRRLRRYYTSAAQIPPDMQEAAHDIRNILENAYTSSADRASQELGVKSISDEWKKAKKMYQTSSYIDDVINSTENRRLKNSKPGLINTLIGVGAAAHYGLIPGLAAAAGAKVLREFGPQIESAVLNRTAKFLAIDKAVQASRKELSDGIGVFLGEQPLKVNRPIELMTLFAGHTQKERNDALQNYMADLKERVANPDAHLEHIADKLGSLPQDAPKLAQELIKKDMAKDKYLLSKAPLASADTGNAFPDKKPAQISDAEIAKFGRYAVVAEKGPKVLINEMKSGSINPETLDATKAIYPESWSELVKDVMDRAAKRTKDFTFPQKQQLHNLLGVQTDRIYSDAGKQILQANYDRKVKQVTNHTMPNRGPGATHMSKGHHLSRARFYTTPVGAMEGDYE